MRRALNALLVLLPAVIMGLIILMAFSHPAHAQRFVVIDDVVRTRLAKDWDKVAKDPFQVEAAYCARYDTTEFAGEVAYRVYAIESAKTLAADHNTILFRCPEGPNIVSLHRHPPASCESETECVVGGKYAYQCFPSDVDENLLTPGGDKPFALIQCDRKAVVFFWPGGVTPPAKR